MDPEGSSRGGSVRTAGVANYGASHWLEPVFADTVVGLGWVVLSELRARRRRDRRSGGSVGSVRTQAKHLQRRGFWGERHQAVAPRVFEIFGQHTDAKNNQQRSNDQIKSSANQPRNYRRNLALLEYRPAGPFRIVEYIDSGVFRVSSDKFSWRLHCRGREPN